MTFNELVRRCACTAYAEPDDNKGHETLSEMAVRFMDTKLTQGSRVLDIGIGNGFALRAFAKAGHKPVGVGIVSNELKHAANEGFEVHEIDMHDVGTQFGMFDAVFARHVLEHSPCPLLVLMNVYEAIKPMGFIYVETPAPNTFCKHEENNNHFSVLSYLGWANLLKIAGFIPLEAGNLPILTPKGIDTYFAIYAQKR